MRWANVGFYFQADIFTFWLAVGIIIFWAALWLIHALSITYGKWRLYRKVDSNSSGCGAVGHGGERGHAPGVSILKPLVGNEDPNLLPNLETFFTQNYPKFELLFCVHSDEDPSLSIVEALFKKYPSVDCRVFKGGQNVGINPKINNMMPGYQNSKYDLILISDSGIRMKDDTLSDMVNGMTDKVGMITQMPFVCDRNTTFANTLEKVFFGGYHARMYLAADSAGILCPTGMSSMMRKQVLEECGGLQTFGKYIAEDYFMGKSVVNKGWKCTISSQPAWQNHGCATMKSFHLRLARWAKLRIAMMPHMILLEPIQECVLNGLLTSWAVNSLFEWNSLLFFLIHVQFWMLLDYAMLRIVQNGPLPFNRYEFAVSWLYREFSALPTFAYALLRPEIRWRDSGSYKLDWGGLAHQVRDGSGKKIFRAPSVITTTSKEGDSGQKRDWDWYQISTSPPSPPPYTRLFPAAHSMSSLSSPPQKPTGESRICSSFYPTLSLLNTGEEAAGPVKCSKSDNFNPSQNRCSKPSPSFPLQSVAAHVKSTKQQQFATPSSLSKPTTYPPLSVEKSTISSLYHTKLKSSKRNLATENISLSAVGEQEEEIGINITDIASSSAAETADFGQITADRQSLQIHSPSTPPLRSQFEII